MYIRTYIEKDAQISRNSYVNMGKNPIANLYFGGTYLEPEYSRYLFYFDVDRLKELYSNCYLGDLSNVTHYLKFKLTGIFGANDLDCASTDYRICLFKVNQDWVEGCGNTNCSDPCGDIITLSTCKDNVLEPVNWYEAKNGENWTIEGVFDAYSGETEYLECQTITCDDEYLEFDITSIINDLITGETLNYGYGLAFHSTYELYPPVTNHQGVSFFSKDTGTYFKPFVETFFQEAIIDTRSSFYCQESNDLCLYAQNRKGQTFMFDETPIVNVYDQNGDLFNTYSAECRTFGVYSINLTVEDCDTQCGIWSDVWTNLKINGVDKSDIELEFDVKEDETWGQMHSGKKHSFSIKGIKRGENIIAEGIRRIYIYARPEYTYKTVGLDNLYYRLYVKQGTNKVLVSDWLSVNKGVCDNWIDIDFLSILPQTYYIDFKHTNGGSDFFYKEEIKFNVINAL